MSARSAWRRLANRLWGRQAEWIVGDGQWATLAWCPSSGRSGPTCLTVQLNDTPKRATSVLFELDKFGCGGGCKSERGKTRPNGSPWHELVDLGDVDG
jgi:hypothetical protein